MVLEAALLGAAGAKTLWGYNRENFMYDRDMRQKMEFKILNFRMVQAGMWRDDIRDITEMTMRKMDNYLIVNTLLLGGCLVLFVEGRMEPGTPPWLLHFYMLTLGGAFVFLLLSIWLAMHASIISQSSAVRLLTQFVRLPIPTWEELEEARTYGSSFEKLSAGRMFRVPFMGRQAQVACTNPDKDKEPKIPRRATSGSPRRTNNDPSVRIIGAAGIGFLGNASLDVDRPDTVDPWALEQSGENRGIYELKAMPASLRRHIGLVRRAAMQYQCFDAFARVAMTFGINQMLHAISYQALGYVAHTSGSHTPAWCACIIMLSMSLALVQLDFALSDLERLIAGVLVVGGPLCAAGAILIWAFTCEHDGVMVLACLAYMLHGAWLLFATHLCGIHLQANGCILPMKIRAVLYLDVFGWLGKNMVPGESSSANHDPTSMFGRLTTVGMMDDPFLRQCSQDSFARQYSHQQLNEMEQAEGGAGLLGTAAASSSSQRRRPPGAPGVRRTLSRKMSASGELFSAPAEAFKASSYAPAGAQDRVQADMKSAVDEAGTFPALVFRMIVNALVGLWVFGSAAPFFSFWHHIKLPVAASEAFAGPRLRPHAALPLPPARAAGASAAPAAAGAGLAASTGRWLAVAVFAGATLAAPRLRQRRPHSSHPRL